MTKDYSGQNLRGRSFKGQNLEGANFSGADIRGTDFTGARLIGANFTGVKSGLQGLWVLFLVALCCLLSALSGFLFLFNVLVIAYIFNSSTSIESQIAGWTTLILTITVYLIIIHQGIGVSLALAYAVALGIGGFFPVALSFGFINHVSFTIAGALALVFTFFQSIVNALVLMIAGNVAGALAMTVGFTVAAILAKAFTFPFTGVLAGAVISAYIAWQAIKGNEKYALVRNLAVGFAAIGGTSFYNANLTEANFTEANLKSTDLRKANLTRTLFHKAKKLDLVRPGVSYLQDANLRQVLITGQGQEKNFNRLDLRGVNFQKAHLTDTSFIAANLSDACFQDADLFRVKLVQAQLDGTDFTGATLTGAYIEDWGITSQTKFDGVRCEYVYMRLPTKENPDPLRKPDNNKEVFADGEFGDFIQPIFDTLDLYHNSGVDPRAIAIAFKTLAENNPEAELEIVAMEKRGSDKFLLRAKTAVTADKSELSAEYFDTYNQIKGLPEREIRLLLSEKDIQIRRLENMVMTALERPNFYSNTQVGQVSTMTNNPGGFSVGGSVGRDINNLQGDNNRAIQGDNNQGVLGDNNQVTQPNQVGGDALLTKDDVVKLLAELEALVKAAELPAETKEEVIEDLSSAKKATDKEEPNKNRALERLGSVADTLEKTTKTVESSQKIWTTAKPIIVKVAAWLGAAAGSHLLGL